MQTICNYLRKYTLSTYEAPLLSLQSEVSPISEVSLFWIFSQCKKKKKKKILLCKIQRHRLQSQDFIEVVGYLRRISSPPPHITLK